MSKTISLKCPNCSAPLNIKPDTTIFACGYCGAEQSVERGGGIIELRLLYNAVKEVKHNTSRAANELSVSRLQKEIEDLEKEATVYKYKSSQSKRTIQSFSEGASLLFILSLIGIYARFNFLYATIIAFVAFVIFAIILAAFQGFSTGAQIDYDQAIIQKRRILEDLKREADKNLT